MRNSYRLKPVFKTVSLDLLDCDDKRFFIDPHTSIQSLGESLCECGIIDPLLVWERDQVGYTLVDGFKRLGWARENGVGELMCAVFSNEISWQDLFILKIKKKLLGSVPNAAEKAQIVAKLTPFVDVRPDVKELFTKLEIPLRSEVLRKWCRLAEASRTLLEKLADGVICERAALDVTGWDRRECAQLIDLFGQLRCSASIQMEILERVFEVSNMQHRTRLEVLSDPQILNIRDKGNLNHRQKTQEIRELLKRWRFPRLHARQDAFLRQLDASSLPASIKITPPPAFEGQNWQLGISFTTAEQLVERLGEATRFAASPEFKSLLNPREYSHRNLADKCRHSSSPNISQSSSPKDPDAEPEYLAKPEPTPGWRQTVPKPVPKDFRPGSAKE